MVRTTYQSTPVPQVIAGQTVPGDSLVAPARANPRSAPKDRMRGFTLLELMVVVIIIAVLAGIAYPAYQKQVIKGRRSDGTGGLQQMASRLEQYYANNKQYTNLVANLGYQGSVVVAQDTITSEQGYYQIQINPTIPPAAATSPPISYTLTATPTPKGGQNNDSSCPSITLNSLNAKGPTGCW